MEFGAGTGVINEALCGCDRGVPMLAVELGEAERESQTVVLVSSSPFRSLPAPVRMPSMRVDRAPPD